MNKSKKNRYALILSGGEGKRLWPLSTKALPKQFLNLVGNKSLLQTTFDRLYSFIDIDKIRISVLEEFRLLIVQQLPSLCRNSIICEPEGRNTAPAIALAAILIQREDPEAVIGVFPVDHHIPTEHSKQFKNDIREAYYFAETTDNVVTIGFEPTFSSTAYGYLEYDSRQKSSRIFKINNYLEKPTKNIAKKIFKKGNCFWNGGIFIFKVSVYLKMLQRFLPKTYYILHKLPAFGSAEFYSRLRSDYKKTDRVSMDYGLMEKLDNIYAVKAKFTRIDLGNFETLSNLWEADKEMNRGHGNILFINCNGCLSYADSKRVVLYNCDGMALLQAGNNIIVCPKKKIFDLDNIKVKIDDK